MSEVILFDLDGTLTDSAEGITKSVQYALSHFGICVNDLKSLECFVGPPLKEQFMKYCNFTEEQAEQAVTAYRERYSTIGIYENRPYDRIYEVLELLRSKGQILAVASSKPEYFVKEILRHFDLEKYFAVVVGSEMDGRRTRKAEVIEEALRRLNYQKRRECVLMVGDRSHDVEGAKECGLQCIGAAYGYGGTEELRKAGAVYIAEKVEDLGILANLGEDEQECAQRMMNAQTWYPVNPTVQQKTYRDNFLFKCWRVIYPLGIHFLIAMIIAILLDVVVMVTNWGSGMEKVQQLILQWAIVATGISGFLTIPIGVWLFKKDEARRLQGTKWLNAGNVLATVLFAVAASHLLNILLIVLNVFDLFPTYQEGMGAAIEMQSGWTLLIVVGIIAPISEELIFRGLIQRRIRDYLGTVWAIIISAVIFGIYHGNMVQFIYATLLGVLLALLYEKTQSLWIPIAAHMAANLWSSFGNYLLQPIIDIPGIDRVIVGTELGVVLLCGIWLLGHKGAEKTL